MFSSFSSFPPPVLWKFVRWPIDSSVQLYHVVHCHHFVNYPTFLINLETSSSPQFGSLSFSWKIRGKPGWNGGGRGGWSPRNGGPPFWEPLVQKRIVVDFVKILFFLGDVGKISQIVPYFLVFLILAEWCWQIKCTWKGEDESDLFAGIMASLLQNICCFNQEKSNEKWQKTKKWENEKWNILNLQRGREPSFKNLRLFFALLIFLNFSQMTKMCFSSCPPALNLMWKMFYQFFHTDITSLTFTGVDHSFEEKTFSVYE